MAVIGIDASRANTPNRTGTEWYIFHLLEHFKQLIPAEHKVILYVQQPLLEDLLPLPANWEVRVLRWPPKLLWTQLRLSIAMLLPWRRPDVLFIPAHTVPVIHPRNSVYVAHDLGFERIPDLYGNSYIGGPIMNALIRVISLGKYGTTELDYHRWSMRFAVKHAKRIITISEFTKRELNTMYPANNAHIEVIYNGFSTNQYTPLDVAEPAVPYFLHVGRVELKKNIPNLITAFAQFKQRTNAPHQLWLVGSPGFGYDEVLKTIQEHAVENDVKLLGYVPTEQMNMLMNQATAFVFPTNYEGFGIPVLEALSAGTPVLCSQLDVLQEIGGDACVYFNQANIADIAKAMQQVSERSESDIAMWRERGIQQARQFSWDRCAKETWQVLQSLLS